MRYRWFVDEKKQTNEYGLPVSRAEQDEVLRPPEKFSYSRGEKLSIVLVILILLYEWDTDNSPVLFLCVSFLTFELRPLAKLFLGEKRGKTISNGLAGFSIAMFVATLLWTLF